MGRPALVHLQDHLFVGVGTRRVFAHELDGGIEIAAVMVRQGNADIQRVAHDIDGAGGEVGVDERVAHEIDRSVVGLHERVVPPPRADRKLSRPLHAHDIQRRPVLPWARGLGGVPLERGIAGREIGDLVDVVGFARIPQQVVQEGAHPGIAALGVACQPDDLRHAVRRAPVEVPDRPVRRKRRLRAV